MIKILASQDAFRLLRSMVLVGQDAFLDVQHQHHHGMSLCMLHTLSVEYVKYLNIVLSKLVLMHIHSGSFSFNSSDRLW